MKYIIILLLFFLPLIGNSQITLNKEDSTFTMSYIAAKNLGSKIESLKSQVNILIQIGGSQDLIIKKLRLKDSLHYLEIVQFEKMDSIMREKNHLSNSIINNYKILLLSTEDQLRAEEKAKRREKIWKNVYKYGYPILIVTAGILIITK